MVLFPHEWISGPNDVRDRVQVFQIGGVVAPGGVAPGELCRPCQTDDGLTPDSAVIEHPAPSVGMSEVAASPRDTPPGSR